VHSVAQCCMCHLALVCFYPVSQSADISLGTSRIRRLRLLSHCSWWSFHFQFKIFCLVLASCEPGEMEQLGGGSGYCISAETAGIRCTTHGPQYLLVLMLEYCASLVTHCHGSVSHELHSWLLGDISTKPLTVPVGVYLFRIRCFRIEVAVMLLLNFCCLLEIPWLGFSHLTFLRVIRPQSFHNIFL